MLRRLVLVALTLGLVLPASIASAATSTGIGAFGPLTGTSTAFRTTMQLPATGFPEATVTTTSRAGQVGPQSGASTWFGANSPVGSIFGSSRDQPYINLRPRADSAASPSVTTYTFDRATPQGWAFVLGDIDADQVVVSGVSADGSVLSADDLVFQSTFNLCDTTPRPSACSGQVTDQPSWDPATTTLTGNSAARDTYGAAAWFRPTTSLTSLTFTFTARSGFPVFQTWFAVTKQDVTGTIAVSAGECDVAGTTLQLLDASGATVSSTRADAQGAYQFLGVASSDGYRVAMTDVPEGCRAAGPTEVAVDLSDGDDTADFSVREIIPVPISGRVASDDGVPLAGVTVRLSDGSQTTTDNDGRYVFDDNPVGSYTLSIETPEGYDVQTSPGPAVITPETVDPIIDQDFVLDPRPGLSGTVSDSTGPVGGVTVVLRDAGGEEIDRTVTVGDGTYLFDRLPAGDYTVSVPDPPADYRAPDPRGASVADEEVTGVDLLLARPGSITGSVTVADTAEPVVGATVTLTGPGGTLSTTTDGAGNYLFDDLDPGEYVVAVGELTRPATVDALGGSVGGIDFAVDEVVTPTPTPNPTPGSTTPPQPPSAGAGPSSAVLPDTGAPSAWPAGIGVLLIAAGTTCVLAARSTRLPHRRV